MPISDLEKELLRNIHSRLVHVLPQNSFGKMSSAEVIEILLFGTDSNKKSLAKLYARTIRMPALKKELTSHSQTGTQLQKTQRDMIEFLS